MAAGAGRAPVVIATPDRHPRSDTEPASVEQQRLLGHTAPSLYDLRGLFQVNVEEGRHLWAMVYLLHAYFGRDGREEAEELLCRHSGDVDKPRILGTFNEPISDWLSFFMFTFFTDRDGKYQLMSLAESGFDPLARTCQFMLTEEAHHMFIGHTGLARVTRRTLEVMAELGTEDPEAVRRAGAIDLPTIQRYINFWFSSSLDLFRVGSLVQLSALYFASGIKGRPNESRFEDHLALSETYRLEAPDGAGGVRGEDIPIRNAMNAAIRSAYVDECQIFLDRWNDQIQRAGFDFRYRLPSERFRRSIGAWAGAATDPEGRLIDRDLFERRKVEWLPTESDRAFIHSLMRPVTEPAKMAAWIAPPDRGINNQPVDYTTSRPSARCGRGSSGCLARTVTTRRRASTSSGRSPFTADAIVAFERRGADFVLADVWRRHLFRAAGGRSGALGGAGELHRAGSAAPRLPSLEVVVLRSSRRLRWSSWSR